MLGLIACLATGACGQGTDPDFAPVLAKTDISTEEIQPGGRFAISFEYQNDGTKAAKRDYTVFLHFEHPNATCEQIKISGHYKPVVGTAAWQPGDTQRVGPYAIHIPEDAAPGAHHIHVGIYDEGTTGERLCEDYVGTITVNPDAPVHAPRQEPLAEADAKTRREALLGRLADPLRMDLGSSEFRVEKATGTWEILDKRSQEVWSSNALSAGLGQATLKGGDRTLTLPLDSPHHMDLAERLIVAHYVLAPDDGVEVKLRVKIERVGGPDGAKLTWEADEHETWEVVATRLLDNGLMVTNNDAGRQVIAHRLGLIMDADGGLPDTRVWRAYSNNSAYSMAFAGAVKNGSAIMLAWDNVYTNLETRGDWVDHELVPGTHTLTMSMHLRGAARSFTIHPLGKGNYLQVAKSYREIAKRRGFLRTWADKQKSNPNVEKMWGAVDFKPFVFMRTAANTRWNDTDEERLSLSYTFDEAAQCAEHLRNEVGIERAMYVLAGWLNRGYDNKHPDILPAAPECGGDEGLTDCGDRVRDCGYIFGLHDNYQDMYRDAPSWDETFIQKRADGSLHRGGEWAGGWAYLTCSKKALELARRPQNLNEVRRLFHPGIYFIDTTFAAPPYECHDPEHPMTLSDDIHWKRELSKYARKTFGLFGSEEGQEWAVPDADYFEGIMSQRTHSSSETIVPLFEAVYGDCINLLTHQGDRATPGKPKYILDHILYAETPLYHFGPHLYFEKEGGSGGLPARPEVAGIEQTGERTFDITYRWQVSGPAADLEYVFVHFTHPDSDHAEKIVFQNDHQPDPPANEWQAGDSVELGPLSVEIPEGREGTFAIMLGALGKDRERLALRGLQGVGSRYPIGAVTLRNGKITLTQHSPSAPMDISVLERADNGWAEELIETDRMIKNTYEVCSALNRLTAHMPLTDHQFVSSTPRVERTVFGDEFEVVVNYGPGAYATDDFGIPQWGFVAQSRHFWAFHATRFGVNEYDPSALFVVESLDDRPISLSEKTRIFHGFGDPHITVAGKEFEVRREAEVDVAGR